MNLMRRIIDLALAYSLLLSPAIEALAGPLPRPGQQNSEVARLLARNQPKQARVWFLKMRLLGALGAIGRQLLQWRLTLGLIGTAILSKNMAAQTNARPRRQFPTGQKSHGALICTVNKRARPSDTEPRAPPTANRSPVCQL